MRTRFILLFLQLPVLAWAGGAPLSPTSKACEECHLRHTPRVVQEWRVSRHAAATPADGLQQPPLRRRVSADSPPAPVRDVAVGCFECHGANAEGREDTFDHFGQRIHLLVTPQDCATCHPVEERQFAGSKKAHARGNIENNPVYAALKRSLIGSTRVLLDYTSPSLISEDAAPEVEEATCSGCHGGQVSVNGVREAATAEGTLTFPRLEGWPNRGVGRTNPDGSKGNCSACHGGHRFAITEARTPQTCARCHDVPKSPAWEVYRGSAHGLQWAAVPGAADLAPLPWTPGRDFAVPTCAACHASLLTGADGAVIAERTHDFGSRLWQRLYGAIFSHPQPRDGDTSKLRNQDRMPLPTDFDGGLAPEGLLSGDEQSSRQQDMGAICASCHTGPIFEARWAALAQTAAAADQAVLAATQLQRVAWQTVAADPADPFDELLERKWVEQWMELANRVRLEAAMGPAPSLNTFGGGWSQINRNLREMKANVY